MIKLIIFDLSDVCFNSEEPPFLEKFAEKHGLNFDELNSFYQELLVKAEVDEIDGEEVWKQVLNKFNVKEDIDKIITEMIQGKEAFPEVLELVRQLRTKYKTAYLTNYCKKYWDLIAKKFDLTAYFDFGVVSYQVKSRKPATKGFQAILEHFGVKPEETVFIDDSEKNLVKAEELGIKTIHFKDKEQLSKELEELRVLSSILR